MEGRTLAYSCLALYIVHALSIKGEVQILVFKRVIIFSMKLATVWSSANYHDQQHLQFLVFPEGIFYNRKIDKCRIENINPVFRYIIDLERVIAEKKNGTALQNLECAALVEDNGVEPMTSCMPCKRSSQLS